MYLGDLTDISDCSDNEQSQGGNQGNSVLNTSNDTTMAPPDQFKEILNHLYSQHQQPPDSSTNLAQWAARLEVEGRTMQKAVNDNMSELKLMILALTEKVEASEIRLQRFEGEIKEIRDSVRRYDQVNCFEQQVSQGTQATQVTQVTQATQAAQVTQATQATQGPRVIQVSQGTQVPRGSQVPQGTPVANYRSNRASISYQSQNPSQYQPVQTPSQYQPVQLKKKSRSSGTY